MEINIYNGQFHRLQHVPYTWVLSIVLLKYPLLFPPVPSILLGRESAQIKRRSLFETPCRILRCSDWLFLSTGNSLQWMESMRRWLLMAWLHLYPPLPHRFHVHLLDLVVMGDRWESQQVWRQPLRLHVRQIEQKVPEESLFHIFQDKFVSYMSELFSAFGKSADNHLYRYFDRVSLYLLKLMQ